MAPLVRGCIELGLTIIPRGGGTGYTGGAIPLTPLSAVINTEKLIDLGAVEERLLPEAVPPLRDHPHRRRRRHGARLGSRCCRRPRLCRRPDVGGSLLHRRQRRDERRRQESRALGNRARQPGVVEDGRSERPHHGSGTRLDHNFGKIHEQEMARFEIRRFRKDGRTLYGNPEILEIPAPAFASRASARTSPTSSWPVCREFRRKAPMA
jgi:hypothetical protein